MIVDRFGGRISSTRTITISSANAPLSRSEAAKVTKRRKNEEPIEDTERYRKKVAKERAALALEQQTKGDSKESPTTITT